MSGKDDEEEYLVLFRFAVSDYVSEMVNLRGEVYADGQAYVAQETVFFDFDVIQLSFLKGEDWTIIPCVSSPIDIVNAITTPTHIPDDTSWWQIVVAILALILLIVLLHYTGLLPLVSKVIVWIICLPFRIIAYPFKAIKKRKQSNKRE